MYFKQKSASQKEKNGKGIYVTYIAQRQSIGVTFPHMYIFFPTFYVILVLCKILSNTV